MKNRSKLSRLLEFLVVSCFCAGLAMAQGDRPNRILRLLALGEAPPFEVVEKDGARVEVDAPEGSVPPNQVMTRTGNEGGKPVRLLLNRFSGAMLISGNSVALHEAGPGGLNSKPWHTLKMPRSTHALALLWRDPEENQWTKAQSLTLADDANSFAPGMVRIVNISPSTAQVVYDGEEFELESGEVEMRGSKGAAIEQVSLEVKVENDRGRTLRVHSGSINQAAGERTNVIIYRADGERPRRPVKVYVRPEDARKAVAPIRRRR